MNRQQTDQEHCLGVLWVFIALVTCTAPGRQAGSPLSHDGERQSPEITFTSGSEVWYRDVKKGRQAEAPPHLALARCVGGAQPHSSSHICAVSWNPDVSLLHS